MSGTRLKAVKVVVAGGFAAGKTTLVSTVSDIQPFTTEAPMTELSIGIDDAGDVAAAKRTTTVAFDFGRAEMTEQLWLYLFGTPGQERFSFMWDELCDGAIGAILIVDTRRLEDCFRTLDHVEASGLPFIVLVNCFDGVAVHRSEQVRRALAIADDVPVLLADARRKAHVKTALTTLVEHGISRARQALAAAAEPAAMPSMRRATAVFDDDLPPVPLPAGQVPAVTSS